MKKLEEVWQIFVKSSLVIIASIFINSCGGEQGGQENTSADYHTQKKDIMEEEATEEEAGEEAAEILAPEGEENGEFDNTNESYEELPENDFINVTEEAISTFSIDVDAASYTNTRRYIQNGSLPPPAAVRLEEFINYFDYDYKQPTGNLPFSVNTEIGDCPWNPSHKLIHIGLQGKKIPKSQIPPSNLVFLIDASGSMDEPNKLPLLKRSFKLLLNNLNENDRVAIVTYAGSAGLVLPSTSAGNKRKIMRALDNLEAGGSTAGGEGIRLAYAVAKNNLKKSGNNRVIIATDGDFNVGESSDEATLKLIEEKRKEGIAITVLGLGMGNYKDSKMETIADNGNGNYYYIDTDNEANKVFGAGLTGTLFTIAKDVKIQVEFNKTYVKSYRLIGYENRVMANEDFEDDSKDAGEIGAGHTVTALYEVEMASNTPNSDMMQLRLRYKKPKENTSRLIEHSLKFKPTTWANASNNYKFSASVASFGMILRESKYKGKTSFQKVMKWTNEGIGKDRNGYRAEFLDLVKIARKLNNAN